MTRSTRIQVDTGAWDSQDLAHGRLDHETTDEAMAYVRECRLQQARLLLGRPGQPVKVIAWSVGFSDMSHFNRTFRKATGMAPLAYRAKAKPRGR